MKGCWVPHDTRDQIVDCVGYWTERTEIPACRLLGWMELGTSKFYDWKQRYGKVNEHNAKIPRDFWLEDWERTAILDYFDRHPLEGYRRLTFPGAPGLDDDVVAVSPSSVYRVLRGAGRLDHWNGTPSKKGTGFVQPLRPHQHWHIDVSYINIAGTFYFLTCLLDGCSRYIVHWELLEAMKEPQIELIIQRGLERYPSEKPRIISDNGPQFIARDFKEFVRLVGITHVRTSPYYPLSNGKIERFHKTLKTSCIRPKCPETLEEGRQLVADFILHYNTVRLHSAIGYITPADRLNDLGPQIHSERDRKLADARERRRQMRQAKPHAKDLLA